MSCVSRPQQGPEVAVVTAGWVRSLASTSAGGSAPGLASQTMSGVPVCCARRTTLAAAWRKAASASVVRGGSVGSGMRSVPPSVRIIRYGSG